MEMVLQENHKLNNLLENNSKDMQDYKELKNKIF